MNKSLQYTLQLMALILWYLSLIFILTAIFLNSENNFLYQIIRGKDFRWDYEAMFSSIYVVWGTFLWKASKNPQINKTFIYFTIAANVFHAIVMTIVGILRPGEFYHLLIDSLVLFIPSVLLLYLAVKEFKNELE